MNLQFYLEKLKSSELFQDFMKENPEAFLCSGFFVIDKQANNNQIHFDFYISDKNKMFSFKLEGEIEKIPIETITEIPEKISDNCDFNFEQVEKLIIKAMTEKNVNNKIQRILLSLQKKKDKYFLVGSVFISALGMIRIDIKIPEMKVVSFEKKSFFDMIKIIKKRD